MKFISFFAGIGGIDLGLERAGHKCVGQVEIDDYCLKVLEKHWPDVKRWKDITKVDPAELPEAELWVAGDPCQENSNARQVGAATQPSLAHEFLRLIAACRPSIVLRENPTRTRADAPWPWQRIRQHLERLNYVVLPFRLRACCFGADHQRDRLFLLADTCNAKCKGLEGQGQGISIAESSLQRQWPPTEPGICGERDGVPYRMERLVGIGNALPPIMAEWIGRQLK